MHPVFGRHAYFVHFGAEGAAERLAEADRICAPVRAEVAQLRAMSPGPELVTRLVEVQAKPIDTEGGIDLVACWDRALAWAESQRMAALSTAFGQPDHESDGWVAADLAATTHTSEQRVADDVATARRVGAALPQTWLALQAGDIGPAHLRAMERPLGCSPCRSRRRSRRR